MNIYVFSTRVTVSNNPRYAISPLPSDTSKYSFVGSFDPRVLSDLHGIPEDEAELLSNFANASLARNTWKQYSSALRGFLKFHEAADIIPTFPPATSTMLRFVAYCLRKRLKSATIRSYISGIKKMCLTITGTLPELLSPYLNAVLLGAQKLDGRVGQKVAVDTKILNSHLLWPEASKRVQVHKNPSLGSKPTFILVQLPRRRGTGVKQEQLRSSNNSTIQKC